MDRKKYNEPQALNDVAAFHRLFELPIEDQPKIPDASRCMLRVNLIQEELNELKEAIENNDLVEVADALADLQYVLSGAVLEFGLADKFKEIFDDVQRSNMSKACVQEEDAKETVRLYVAKGQDGYIEQKDDLYLVYRKEDNKVLKCHTYQATDIAKILEN